MNDEKLSRWAERESEKRHAQMKKLYKEAAKAIAAELKTLVDRLKAIDQQQKPFFIPVENEHIWRAAKRSEAVRNAAEVPAAAKRLAETGAQSRVLAFALFDIVYRRNMGELENAFVPDEITEHSFDLFRSPSNCESRLQRLFAPFVTGFYKLRDFSIRLADAVGGFMTRCWYTLRTTVKRVQNQARMAWMRIHNSFSSIKYGKKWRIVNDDRVRDSHVDMDGQVRPLEEPFVTGAGNLIMYPGDTSAPVSEWINCRCDLIRVVIK